MNFVLLLKRCKGPYKLKTHQSPIVGILGYKFNNLVLINRDEIKSIARIYHKQTINYQ